MFKSIHATKQAMETEMQNAQQAHPAGEHIEQDFRDGRALITVKAQTKAWLNSFRKPTDLIAALESGDGERVLDILSFANGDYMGKGENAWTMVGTAEVTLTLMPRDEQVQMCVTALNAKLDAMRDAYNKARQAILADISKLQAIGYEAPAEVEA